MSTTNSDVVRFLVIQESLEDRSAIATLRKEGHSIGVLVPPDSPVYPIPDDVSLFVDHHEALEEWDASVYFFPQPFVPQLARDLIVNKKFAVGSSPTHCSLATPDAVTERNLCRTAGVPYLPSTAIHSYADWMHLRMSSPRPTYLMRGPKSAYYGSPEMYSEIGLDEYFQAYPNRYPSIVTPIPEDLLSMPGNLITVGLMLSGKQEAHRFMVNYGNSGGTPYCRISDMGIFGKTGKVIDAVSKILVSLRYTGPVFISLLTYAENYGRDWRILVTAISSVCPPGFWPTYHWTAQYQKGLGKALLHIGRWTLKSPPDMNHTLVSDPVTYLATLDSDYDRQGKISARYAEGYLEDAWDGRYNGPKVGWIRGPWVWANAPFTLAYEGLDLRKQKGYTFGESRQSPDEEDTKEEESSNGYYEQSLSRPGGHRDGEAAELPESGVLHQDPSPDLDVSDGPPGFDRGAENVCAQPSGAQCDGDLDHPHDSQEAGDGLGRQQPTPSLD